MFAEWDGLLGIPTSTKASLQPTKPIERTVKQKPSYVLSELTEGMTTTGKKPVLLPYRTIVVFTNNNFIRVKSEIRVQTNKKGVSIHIYSRHTVFFKNVF